ncbi:MAG TPA: hypothetical protein VFQ07_01765, partial [Candidatus Polarisedimenticolia bacterium]|nr:hypothetical protein [Candidatus Polarisedimenticolia bacterium]
PLPATTAASPPPAPSPTASTGRWQQQVALYVAAVGMSGRAGVGGVEADVDIPFSEIMDQLEAAGMIAWRAEKGDWAVFANVIFMGLGATKDLRFGGTAEADFDETLFELDGARRFAKRWEVYGGARLVDIDASLELRPVTGTTLHADGSKTWVDPLVGVRYQAPLGDHWSFVGRADVGGFGVGSDLAWQALVHFDWRLSKHWGAAFGYVLLDIDYDDGEGSDAFLYDIRSEGPVAAATIAF